MKKNLKKMIYVLGASILLIGCKNRDTLQKETEELIIETCEEETYQLETIKVLNCDAQSWYTNRKSGADAFYGNKIYIEDEKANSLFHSSYYYRGIYEDEHAFLGDNYTSLQDENTMIHSYSGASLKPLSTVLIEKDMEYYIKESYTNEELIELNYLLNISNELEISHKERILHP